MEELDNAPSISTRQNRITWILILAAILIFGALGFWFYRTSSRPLVATAQGTGITSTVHADSNATHVSTQTPTSTPPSPIGFSSFVESLVSHVPLPDEVRGIYLTSLTAGSSRADELLEYSIKSGLNAWVIDVKLDNGELAFVPQDPELQKYASAEMGIKDLDGLLEKLKTKGIYRIARIFVMRDGAYGKLHPNVSLQSVKGGIWHDKTGTPWLDPAAPEVADYSVKVAKEVYARGFDEIQFDYVRYPTDGRVSEIVYPVYDEKTPKAKVMKNFFDRVNSELKRNGIPVSYDLYGMTFLRTDDFGIGQRLASVYPDSVAVSPMVYPSHYPDGFQGFANPAEHPYEVVKISLDKGLEMLKIDFPQVDPKEAHKKFRPWIQDFDIGAEYDAKKIQAQIKAARDAHSGGWLLWNARNVYTETDYRD